MITAIVEFSLPRPFSHDEAASVFKSTAPKYLGIPGLVRKYYCISEDGTKAGGIYLWTSKEAAMAVYTPEWSAFVREKYGTEPRLSFLEYPVVVDNTTNEILAG